MTKGQPRKFATRKAKAQEETEIGFDLGETHYDCRPEIQGAVILEFIAAADNGNSGAAAQILPFFDEVLPEDELEKFKAQLKSKDEIIEMETLSEIVGYLIEEYTDRPTEASTPSDAGS